MALPEPDAGGHGTEYPDEEILGLFVRQFLVPFARIVRDVFPDGLDGGDLDEIDAAAGDGGETEPASTPAAGTVPAASPAVVGDAAGNHGSGA